MPMWPMAKIRFVIISQVRTGSMLIKEMLNAHTRAMCLNEIFQEKHERRLRWHRHHFHDDHCFLSLVEGHGYNDPADYLRFKLWPLGEGVHALGFKLLYSQATRWRLWEYLQQYTDIGVIHIIRNPIASFVSLCEARATNLWHSYTDKRIRVVPLSPRHLEPSDVLSFIEETMRGRTMVAGLPNRKFLIRYGDLLRNLDRTIAKVYRTVDLRYEQVEVPMMKTRTATVEQRIANLHQVCAHLPRKYRHLADGTEELI